MTFQKCAILTLAASLLTACGGGGGGAGGNGPNLPQVVQDPPIAASIDYANLTDSSGTSDGGGVVLAAGSGVTETSGSIAHSTQSFTGSGINGPQSLTKGSALDLSGFKYATDVEIDAGTFAVLGVSTLAADVRSTGSAAYTGKFAAQLVDQPSLTVTTLDWTADILVDFGGNRDVDMTFTGGGSELIDTIKVQNARISGNGFAGGTIQTLKGTERNDITGSNVALKGAFFGYDTVLSSPAELGGALHSSDGDTDISGLFLTKTKP